MSDLITERNRLLSRLRLIQHAMEIAVGHSVTSTANIEWPLYQASYLPS